MNDKSNILGITVLEWHSIETIPTMHLEEYAGESWLQSEPLLLADAMGTMAIGFCHLSSEGKIEFEPAYRQGIDEVCMWALLGKPPPRKT